MDINLFYLLLLLLNFCQSARYKLIYFQDVCNVEIDKNYHNQIKPILINQINCTNCIRPE